MASLTLPCVAASVSAPSNFGSPSLHCLTATAPAPALATGQASSFFLIGCLGRCFARPRILVSPLEDRRRLTIANRRILPSRRLGVFAEQSPTKDASEVVIPKKSVSVILLAGGRGKRMGANMPKQYLPLLGRPIALHSFHTFANMPEVMEIIVVCDPSYQDLFEEADSSIPLKFAVPGKERQDSVRSGLQEISKSSKLACIHDSARPLVLTKDILRVMKDAWITGAAVLGVPVKATIKEAGNNRLVSKTLDRSKLWEMQTPQVIEPQLLQKGFELVDQEGYEVTDDVSIVEYLRHPVLITEGSYTNLKVTTPDDLLIAERILNLSPPAPVAVF